MGGFSGVLERSNKGHGADIPEIHRSSECIPAIPRLVFTAVSMVVPHSYVNVGYNDPMNEFKQIYSMNLLQL